MPYVHLANGDVKKLSDEEMNKTFGDTSPVAYRDGNTEYLIIGVYPDEVNIESESEETPTSAQAENTTNVESESTHLGRKK